MKEKKKNIVGDEKKGEIIIIPKNKKKETVKYQEK